MSGLVPDKECVFPFWFKNHKYEECTTVENNGVPWCSTKVNTNGHHIKKHWGICGPTCPGKYEMSNVYLLMSLLIFYHVQLG